MRITTCIGNYAKNPIKVEGTQIYVYSIEELAWVLKENAYFLDEGALNEELLVWIKEELGLKNLYNTLLGMYKGNVRVGAFIMEVMRYTQFFSESDVREVEMLLRKNAGLSHTEKKKNMYDSYQKAGRINDAIDGYRELLHEISGVKGTVKDKITASIHNNLGVALTRLFLFDEAAREFMEAYSLTEEEEYLFAFLSASRITKSETEYLETVGTLVDSSAALKLEERIRKVSEMFTESRENKNNIARKELRGTVNLDAYYRDSAFETAKLVDEYRKMAVGD